MLGKVVETTWTSCGNLHDLEKDLQINLYDSSRYSQLLALTCHSLNGVLGELAAASQNLVIKIIKSRLNANTSFIIDCHTLDFLSISANFYCEHSYKESIFMMASFIYLICIHFHDGFHYGNLYCQMVKLPS